MELALLFSNALLAASILPFSSEALLSALVLAGNHPVTTLWLVATLGNSLGAVLNWGLGLALLQLQHKSWFPFKTDELERAHEIFLRYGLWSLLFAWLPVVGDPLTVIAGSLRVPFLPFIVLVTLGKGLRYALLCWVLI